METPSQTAVEPVVQTDLATAVQQVLAASNEPLTVSKIRTQLPSSLRGISVEELGEFLKRQAAANVLVQYPKYRSQQDRYWDRPMPIHVSWLVREVLQEGPLGLSELRRKLPAYAISQVDAVLSEEVGRGNLYRHPRTGKRGGDRYGVRPADPKDYLRSELAELFLSMESLGFTQEQLREGALELLHEDEWSSTISQARESARAEAPPEGSAAASSSQEGEKPQTSQP
ncbi:MAG TPA: hypothetical protein VGY58_20765 [Gemmataceae bacterium]|jgi:hypothetical protein|nr:hypothetical protein [Gemmataceae bacterium]